MLSIIVDPVIIQLPPDDATKQEVELWLKILTIWLEEALTTPLSWFHYRHATELLEEHDQLPNFTRLKQLQQKHRLDINPAHIVRNVNTFFRDNVLDIEDYVKRLDYAIEPATNAIVIEPEQFVARLPEYLRPGLHLLLADCCACKHIEHPFGQRLYIATQDLQNNPKEITISVVVLDALPDFARPPDNKIIHTIPLLITPDDLPPLHDIIDTWARGEKSIVYAIQYAIQQQQKQEATATTIKPFEFRLGPHFIESVNERGLGTNEIVLRNIIRAAANVILDKAKDILGYSLHKLRISDAPDSPQKERASDNGQAWRLKLQQSGAGWRLHYWKIPTPQGPLIEFANVGKESEREII